ncbi:DUF6308 family protein [Gordonia sputi]
MRGRASELRTPQLSGVSHLIALRDEAKIGSDISAIRVFDILVWMWGSGRLSDSASPRPKPRSTDLYLSGG